MTPETACSKLNDDPYIINTTRSSCVLYLYSYCWLLTCFDLVAKEPPPSRAHFAVESLVPQKHQHCPLHRPFYYSAYESLASQAVSEGRNSTLHRDCSKYINPTSPCVETLVLACWWHPEKIGGIHWQIQCSMSWDLAIPLMLEVNKLKKLVAKCLPRGEPKGISWVSFEWSL